LKKCSWFLRGVDGEQDGPVVRFDRIFAVSVSNGHVSIPAVPARHPKPRLALDPLVEACLKTVQTLGHAIEADLSDRRTHDGADGELQIVAHPRTRRERFLVRTTRTHLSYALASGFIEQSRRHQGNWILFPAPWTARARSPSPRAGSTAGGADVPRDGHAADFHRAAPQRMIARSPEMRSSHMD
jgi:hypothetical protein